jgi:hypothetical protein
MGIRTTMETVSLKYLKQYIMDHVEETEFLELLDITTADLVLAFDDKISDKFDYLVSKLELDEDIDDVPAYDDRD